MWHCERRGVGFVCVCAEIYDGMMLRTMIWYDDAEIDYDSKNDV
jgi:hypothetical protein